VEDDNAWRNTNNSFIVSVFNINFFFFFFKNKKKGMDSYLLLLAWMICVHEGGAHAVCQVRLRFLFLCSKSRAWLMQTLKENLFLTNPSQIRVKLVLVIFTILPSPVSPFKALVGGDKGCMKQLTEREEKKNEKERKKNEAKNPLFWNIKTELNRDNPPPSFAAWWSERN
jgi:hypothetical protein